MDFHGKRIRGEIMKYVKGISLFLVYSLMALGIGFYAGVKSSHFFYPNILSQESPSSPVELTAEEKEESQGTHVAQETDTVQESHGEEPPEVQDSADASEEEAEEVLFSGETLCVDTEYVLEETDILNNTVVETTWRLPDKYVGMNREQFLKAMEVYESFPPLSELERGFIGREVLSFSRDRVVVRMDYKFVQPSSSFYLAVYDNEVVVYLEDMQTVYIETDIRLDSLPDDVQQSIIDMMWIKDEEALYSFLENYSS